MSITILSSVVTTDNLKPFDAVYPVRLKSGHAAVEPETVSGEHRVRVTIGNNQSFAVAPAEARALAAALTAVSVFVEEEAAA